MRRRRGFTCGVLVFAIACTLSAAAESRTLTVLYTNDLHLRFGRLASMAGRIESERAAGGPILLVDAGDAWHDFRRPLTAVWGADKMVEWMNDIGFDAMAVGNHDLYWKSDRLDELSAAARFPLLCANLEPAGGFAAPFVPSALLSFEGIRVLLVGVVTAYHLPYPDYPWLRYLEPTAAIEQAIAASSEPFDLMVVIGHVPVDDAVRIAEAIPAIDVFVSGHSHETTDEPVRVGSSYVVQTGAFGLRLGRLVLDVDATASERLVSHDLLETEKAPTELGRGLLQLLAVLCCLAVTAASVLL